MSPYQVEEKTEQEWLLSSLLAPILLVKDKLKSNPFFHLLLFSLLRCLSTRLSWSKFCYLGFKTPAQLMPFLIVKHKKSLKLF
jgi:hypothetical protein